MHIQILPKEIKHNIFLKLDFPSLGSAAQVCRDWESHQKCEQIWENIYSNYLTINLNPRIDLEKPLCLICSFIRAIGFVVDELNFPHEETLLLFRLTLSK